MKYLGCLALLPAIAMSQPASSPVGMPQAGRTFQSAATQRIEADDFANPGMLWVDEGAKRWQEPRGADGRSCHACHGEAALSMRGVASRHPAWNAVAGRVLTLTDRINQCVTTRQGAPALAPESRERLALAVFITRQSHGLPIRVAVDGPAEPTYERGAALYRQRIGQMNLACTHCHDRHWGKTLREEVVSQGQPDGWPAYRLEWQTMGSLQRRLRACFFGVRAEQPAYDSVDLTALELYLAKRAEGLTVNVPGVRR